MSDHTSPSISSKRSNVFTFGHETIRLENDINQFTRKLEHERHLSLLLDKDIREIKHIIATTKRNLSQKKSVFKLKEKIKQLENLLEVSSKQLGETLSHSKKLKAEINAMRKSATGFHNGNMTAKREIERAKSQIIQTNRMSTDLQKTIGKYNQNIMSTHSRYEHNKNSLTQSISMLRSGILEEKSQTLKFRQGFTVNFAQPIADASELYGIYKNQAQTWCQKNQGLAKEREKLKNHLDELNSALAKMKETSQQRDTRVVVDLLTNSIQEDSRLSHYLFNISEEIFKISEETSMNQDKLREINEKTEEEKDFEILETEKQALAKFKLEKTKAAERLRSLRAKIYSFPDGLKLISEELQKLDIHLDVELPDFDEETVNNVMNLIETHVNSVIYFKKQPQAIRPENPLPKPKLNVNEIDLEKLIEEEIPVYAMSTKEFKLKAAKSYTKYSETAS